MQVRYTGMWLLPTVGNQPVFAAIFKGVGLVGLHPGRFMTATADRQARSTFGLLPFLPLALIIAMFGVAVCFAQIAPMRVNGGVYEVIVGGGSGQFVLATESLTCNRTGDVATCTAPVAGQQLTVDIEYRDSDSPVAGSTCTARHGDRPVSCRSGFVHYGHASNTVWISDQLGVTEPELTRLRDAVPWWRTAVGVPIASLVLLCVLPIAAGVTAYLSSRRARSRAAEWRFPIAAGTGLLGLALFVGSDLMITPGRNFTLGLPIAPGSAVLLIVATVLAAWQRQLVGPSGDGRGRRWAYAIGAVIATAFYTAAALLFFWFDSGFID